MSLIKTYLTKLYAKNFLITLLGLELFFLLIDFLQNQKNIPSSANLIILYFYYQSFAALKVTLALSLVFGALWSFLYLVKSNELTAIESVGVSKKEALKPFFMISLAVAVMYIMLGFTKVGYYYDDAQAILQKKDSKERSEDLFFRYKDEFIYIKEIEPLSRSAKNIQIIGVDGNNVKYSIKAKEAVFEDDGWELKNAETMTINEQSEPHIVRKTEEKLKTLEGFKPKILDNISQSGEGLNIIDAIKALWLLKDQRLSLDKIKSALFSAISLPLFAPFFIMILGYHTPVASRSFMQAKFAAFWIFSTLIGWGVLMALSKLSFYGSAGSYATVFAIVGIGIYARYLFRRLA